jgi:pyridoxal phosphate enzyme (YggS family)
MTVDATKTIQERLNRLRERIARAEVRFGRTPGSTELVAVSKTVTAQRLYETAVQAKLLRFGENYLQESLAKMTDARLSGFGIEWHFIGPLQSNKLRKIATHFDWVHSVDSLAAAQHLNDHRPAHFAPLNICLQVNISNEPSKSGAKLDELPALAHAIASLTQLQLRGLMAIPGFNADFEQQRIPFRTLRMALENLRISWPNLGTLSMGMSNDLEAAIAEGATMLRIGTAIFGPR